MMHSIYVKYIIFALPTYKYLILSGLNSTNVLCATTYHTTFSFNFFLLLKLNLNIQRIPVCIVLLTIFVYLSSSLLDTL